MNKGLTPGDICMPPMPTPALIVRQEGNNAQAHPLFLFMKRIKEWSECARCRSLAGR